jgi:tRNA 5-methylaminomethyl-2-thiouridine biosynthesis bifunctional protein
MTTRPTVPPQVFLDGNQLPQRWQGRERFVVLETGFGRGANFLATWDAWQRDPRRCETLYFISTESNPLRADDLQQFPREPAWAALAQQLEAHWPPLTPDLHRLSFDGGRVQLLLALGDARDWLPELVAEVDAFHLDGFPPGRGADAWDSRLLKTLGRLAAPGATVSAWNAPPAVQDGLVTAGFEVTQAPGQDGTGTVMRARYAPAFVPRRAPSRVAAPSTQRRAIIVGSGLAGSATAAALAAQGWHCELIDRHDNPAQEASGNPAGLFHGIVNAQDGTHARFNRAAALEIARVLADALRDGVPGALDGLLRLETTLPDAAAMQQVIDRVKLPAAYVQALDAGPAARLAGVALRHPAWFYPQGGWVRPDALVRWFIAQGGERVQWRGGLQAESMHRVDPGGGQAQWQLRDAQGAILASAPVIVLANAGDALRLLGRPDWTVEAVRGQLSCAPAAADAGWILPRIPIAGSGYLLPPVDGMAVFGATSAAGDMTPGLREADHARNLAQYELLTGQPAPIAASALQGRTAWRWVAGDRLPIVGAVPDLQAAVTRPIDQVRFVPRVPGLFVFTALGSRGITWSALGARVLASAITGAPAPLQSSLLDAIDPGRFAVRQVARRARRDTR